MTAETVALVQSSFARVAPIADTAAELFYDRLFTLDPSLRPLFSTDMRPQKHALMATLTLAVNHLQQPEELVPVVTQLGLRHRRYGVQPAHYDTVGAALLWTLEQGLGSAFTPAVRDAWATVYGWLATTMQTAAATTTGDPEAPQRAV